MWGLFLICCAHWVLLEALNVVLFPTKCIEDLGCFYTGPPFYHPIYRPISVPPNDTPNTTEFLLYTPDNRQNPIILKATNESLETSTLDTSRATKILLHGFDNKLTPDHIFFEITRELLEECSCNVIILNYTGAVKPPYNQAVANARVVGAQGAKFINFHVERRGLDPKDVHLIGHSLGGQTAGWVGERVKGLGRITGSDPAGPYFQHAERRVRLDHTDAEFVDVIHTNGGNNILEGYGLYQAIGHIDFYPNGGKNQPGCGPYIPGPFPHCSHNRTNNYFLESIRRCHYVGVKCDSYENYLNNQCTTMNSLTAVMGYHAIKVSTEPENSRFFLRTAAEPPFCMENN